MYHQFNVVTHSEDTAHALSARAGEPVEGLDVMRRWRKGRPEYQLTSGPSGLCIALGIDRSFDKADLRGDRVWIEEGVSISRRSIARGPRLGLAYAENWVMKPWRFWVKDNPFVSKR